jgi:fatty acid desaturase
VQEMVKPLTPPTERRTWVGGTALRAAASALAIACFTSFLVLMRAVMVCLGPFFLALTKLGGARIIGKAAFPVLVLSNAGLFALCWNAPPSFIAASWWTPIRLAGIPLLLVCSGIALGKLVASPPTLDELRARVTTQWPARWFARKLHNPLDAHFAGRVGLHTCIVAPAFVAMFLPQTRGLFAFAYWGVSLNLIAISHEALDHTNIHNHFFRTSHLEQWGDRVIVGGIGWFLDYVLNPMCGRIPNWYRVQHVAVHHAEDNGPEDNQSTIHYDRMSFFDTGKAALKFAISMVLPIDVVLYLARKRRQRPLRRIVVSMAGYYGAVGALAMVHWPSAAFMVLMRFLFGQSGTLTYYQWHVFADPADPMNNYKSSVNLTDGTNDHGYFGVGVHIEHHLHQARHWSQLAADATANRSAYEREEVILLTNGANSIMKAIWRRRYDELASVMKAADGSELPLEKLRELVWSRTRPLQDVPRPALYAKLDDFVGRAVATYLM